MGALALLFPGQASQAVGMGVDLLERSPRARAIFEAAEGETGLPIARLCSEGPLERLTETDVAQPAVVATSLAALAVLEEVVGAGLGTAAVAGHSVGEYAAAVPTGALDAPVALALVHARARAMSRACAAVEGTMAAVLGLDEEPLVDVCARASGPDGTVQVANLNAPGQVVISGARVAVERAGPLAREAGARRVLPLNVGGPFHSVYMQPAVDDLERAVADAPIREPRVPIVGNVEARAIATVDDLRAELRRQVAAPVRWTDTLRRLADMGCDRFLEVGPGQALAGMVKRTLPDARVASFGSLADLDTARTLLR